MFIERMTRIERIIFSPAGLVQAEGHERNARQVIVHRP
jgi:hypothetical protein